MASITIRKLDDTVKARLRVRAAQNGRSMEEEARTILESAIASPVPVRPRANMAERMRSLFEPLGGVELDIPPRTGSMRRIPDFAGPEFNAGDDKKA